MLGNIETNNHKKGSLGWLREQKKKKEFNKVDNDKAELGTDKVGLGTDKAEFEKDIPKIIDKAQCEICGDYFQIDDELDELDNNICNDCWILVNK